MIETPCWKDQEGVALEPARSLDMPPTQYVHNYGTGWSNNANDWLVYGGMWPFYNQMPYPGFPGLKDGHVIVAFADTHVKSRPVISTTQGCDAYTDGYQAGRVQDKDKFIWDFE